MIVSHKHKMIFFHCRKTGGSSIKLSIYPYLGDDDIILGGISEIIQNGYRLNRAARSTLRAPESAATYVLARLRGVSHAKASNIAIKRHYKKLSELPEHATAAELKSYFPKEFANYYKFAFVRNPFTQVVSDFFWRRKNTGEDLSFSAYIDLLVDNQDDHFVHRGRVKNIDIISLNGKVICDFVGKFENLANDFQHVTEAIGIDCRLSEMVKPGDHGQPSYGSLYTPVERKKVESLFALELCEFGYSWPFE